MRSKKSRVLDYPYVVVKREGNGGGVDGGLRRSVEISRRAFPAPRRGAADSPGNVARLESVRQDGIGDRVAVDGRMQR